MRALLRSSRPVRSIAALVCATLLAVGCGDADDASVEPPPVPPEPTTSGAVPTAPPEQGEESGLVAVRIEEVEGIFTEGFEVGLRFETGDGDVIESMLWSDVVATQGPSTPASSYDAVLEQPVPVGEVVVFAEVTVGTGPPPSVPDLDGDLPCRVELRLAEDERAELEVRFDPPEDCLRQVDP
jgi:hypothetical protein